MSLSILGDELVLSTWKTGVLLRNYSVLVLLSGQSLERLNSVPLIQVFLLFTDFQKKNIKRISATISVKEMTLQDRSKSAIQVDISNLEGIYSAQT